MVCLLRDLKILLTAFSQSYNCQTSHYLGRNWLPKPFLILPSLGSPHAGRSNIAVPSIYKEVHDLPYTIFQKWRVKSIRKNAVPQLPEQSSLKVVKLVKKKSVIGSLREFLNLSINRTAETKRRKYVELKKRPSPNRSRNTLIRRWVSIQGLS